MKLFIKSAIVLALVVSLFFLAGFISQENFQGEVKTTLNCKPEEAWNLLTNLDQYPKFKPGIKSVRKMGTNKEGFPVWRETTRNGGEMTLEILEAQKPNSLTIHLIECPYGINGIWHYQIEPVNGQTQVTITEESQSTHVITRALHLLAGRSKHLNAEAERMHQLLEK